MRNIIKRLIKKVVENLYYFILNNKILFNIINYYYEKKNIEDDLGNIKKSDVVLFKRIIGTRLVYYLKEILYKNTNNILIVFLFIYNKVLKLIEYKPKSLSVIFTLKIYLGIYDERISNRVFRKMILFTTVDSNKSLNYSLNKTFKINLLKFLEYYQEIELHYIEINFINENEYQEFVRINHREPTREEYESFIKKKYLNSPLLNITN